MPVVNIHPADCATEAAVNENEAVLMATGMAKGAATKTLTT